MSAQSLAVLDITTKRSCALILSPSVTGTNSLNTGKLVCNSKAFDGFSSQICLNIQIRYTTRRNVCRAQVMLMFYSNECSCSNQASAWRYLGIKNVSLIPTLLSHVSVAPYRAGVSPHQGRTPSPCKWSSCVASSSARK